jgi:hypothetical protein
MEELKIESVTFYKLSPHSTQIYEKNIKNSPLMSISLPRVKFLEKDGEYRPAWAVERISEMTAGFKFGEKENKYKKEVFRKTMSRKLFYEITDLEQTVYDMYRGGMSLEEICQATGKRASTVGGAYARFQSKTLAKQRKK